MRSAAAFTLLLIVPWPASAQPAIREALASDPEWARALAADLGRAAPTPEERGRVATETYVVFLRWARERASAARRAGDAELAADLAMAILADPPIVVQGTAVEGPQHYVLGNQVAHVRVPVTEETTAQLNDLVFFVLEAGASEEVFWRLDPVLRQITERRPSRAAAALNYADLLWSRHMWIPAVAEYRRYLALRGARAPERVRERIQMGRPPEVPRPTPEEIDIDGTVWQRLISRVGALAGGEVSIEQRVSTECLSDDCDVVATLVWSSAGASRRTIVMETLQTNFSADTIRASIEGEHVVLRYPENSRYDDSSSVTERWAFRPEARRFERVERQVVRPPRVGGSPRYDRVVSDGDLERARGIVARMGTGPSGGHWDEAESIEWQALGARVRMARRYIRQRQPERASSILRLAVEHMEAVRSHSDEGARIEGARATAHRALLEMLRASGAPSDRAAADAAETWTRPD